MNTEVEKSPNFLTTINIVYLLYLVGLLLPVTGLIGVVVAYVNRNSASDDWTQSHYRFQIRTFWIGTLYLVVGIALAPVMIGYVIVLFWAVWLIIRAVKGIKFSTQKQPLPDEASWLFG
jgi:uncharacterized membrane protein